VINDIHVVLMLAPIKRTNQPDTRSHEQAKRDAQKINCENHAGKIAKGEKAAELGLERLRERIHRKHGDDIRTGVFQCQHHFFNYFQPLSLVS
jgi:hypothetical protein